MFDDTDEAIIDCVDETSSTPNENAQGKRKHADQRAAEEAMKRRPRRSRDGANADRAGGRSEFDQFAANAYFDPIRQQMIDRHYGAGTASALISARLKVTQILFSDAHGSVAGIQLGDRSLKAIVLDRGNSLASSTQTVDEARLMVELAIAKGWPAVNIRGNASFCAEAMAYAESKGMRVSALNGKSIESGAEQQARGSSEPTTPTPSTPNYVQPRAPTTDRNTEPEDVEFVDRPRNVKRLSLS